MRRRAGAGRPLARLALVFLLWAGLVLPAGSAVAQEPLGAADLVLLQAALGGNRLLALDALAQGADIEARAPSGDTQLLLAAQSGSLEVVALLLSKDADPGAASIEGAAVGVHQMKIQGRRIREGWVADERSLITGHGAPCR